jgi:uncharacterized protein (TIGR02145 family)
VVSSTTSTITVRSNSVTIGTQVWTTNNLDITAYRNGDLIPQVTDPTAWAGLTTGAWCYYNNDPANGAIYGKLYNWYAVNDTRGLAPAGWRIPTDAEWTTQRTFLGGYEVAGGKMKSIGTDRWNSPNTGATNSSGFTALPGGYRYNNGTFGSVGNRGYWWSTTEWAPTTYAASRYLEYNSGTFWMSVIEKNYGYSVRLIKN